MPSYVPRELEPYQKKEILVRREQQLRRALRSRAGAEKVHRAAENVRAAYLAVLKASGELIRYTAESEQSLQQLANIEREQAHWSTVSAEEIASDYEQALTIGAHSIP